MADRSTWFYEVLQFGDFVTRLLLTQEIFHMKAYIVKKKRENKFKFFIFYLKTHRSGSCFLKGSVLVINQFLCMTKLVTFGWPAAINTISFLCFCKRPLSTHMPRSIPRFFIVKSIIGVDTLLQGIKWCTDQERRKPISSESLLWICAPKSCGLDR